MTEKQKKILEELQELPVDKQREVVNKVFSKVYLDDLKEEGDSVVVLGSISFTVKHRNARKGRNPQTGKEIKIEEKNVITAKVTGGINKKEKK